MTFLLVLLAQTLARVVMKARRMLMEHNQKEALNMREFLLPHDAIQAEAEINIAAPPEHVAAVYRDVEKWSNTFSATIESAHITKIGDNWKWIEVTHKKEGRVPNTLFDLSDTEIGLEESKKKFSASFLNHFEPAVDGGTRYIIRAYISLKGIYKILKPLLRGYVRRQTLEQMRRYVLHPLKTAAEKSYGPK